MASASPVFKLAPGIQDYAWGKKGGSSLAAQFADVSVKDFQIKEDKTYAELWMGTHPNLPSTLTSNSQNLSSHLASNPSLIGNHILKKFGDSKEGNLPFLFKVLSIGTALSIQAHPSKELAGKLFKERPEVYKDPNHKPEMAIALTPFLAFLNFLPLPSLLEHLQTVPELEPLIPSTLTSSLADSLKSTSDSKPTSEQKSILQKIFSALMNAPEDKVKVAIDSLIARYDKGEKIADGEKGLVDLVKMLNEQYPGDVGVLCCFMLNLVELKVGEAAFLAADMPHAYIKGDIIECMATSDNVVRAGLTPKLRDVPTLVSMLTYEAGPASQQLLKPVPFSSSSKHSLLYDPPIDEFSVVKVDVGKGDSEKHRKVEGPSLVIVTEGSGGLKVEGGEDVEVNKGEVVFVGSGVEVEWTGGDEGLEVFRAYVEA